MRSNPAKFQNLAFFRQCTTTSIWLIYLKNWCNLIFLPFNTKQLNFTHIKQKNLQYIIKNSQELYTCGFFCFVSVRWTTIVTSGFFVFFVKLCRRKGVCHQNGNRWREGTEYKKFMHKFSYTCVLALEKS